MVHPGIPVDPADLEKMAGLVHKGQKQLLTKGLHGLIEVVYIILLVLQEPFSVIIEADSPEKIHSFRCEACKHGAPPSWFWIIIAGIRRFCKNYLQGEENFKFAIFVLEK
jgi:hypothetical protein